MKNENTPEKNVKTFNINTKNDINKIEKREIKNVIISKTEKDISNK